MHLGEAGMVPETESGDEGMISRMGQNLDGCAPHIVQFQPFSSPLFSSRAFPSAAEWELELDLVPEQPTQLAHNEWQWLAWTCLRPSTSDAPRRSYQ